MKLQGIFAEITTPFDHKGDIYKTKVEHNVEKWNRTTLAGYVVCGRAGEGELLAAEEKAAVWEMLAKWASRKMLIATVAMPAFSVTLANRQDWALGRASRRFYRVPKSSWRIFAPSRISPGFR
jgi:4-hydroxy-2-oxoglutarate aldolase